MCVPKETIIVMIIITVYPFLLALLLHVNHRAEQSFPPWKSPFWRNQPLATCCPKFLLGRCARAPSLLLLLLPLTLFSYLKYTSSPSLPLQIYILYLHQVEKSMWGHLTFEKFPMTWTLRTSITALFDQEPKSVRNYRQLKLHIFSCFLRYFASWEELTCLICLADIVKKSVGPVNVPLEDSITFTGHYTVAHQCLCQRNIDKGVSV